MARTFLAALLLTAFVDSGGSSSPRQPSPQVVIEAEPEPSRARPLDRWPNAADCRQPGGHGRGCWVVDRIVGKK
jgi:hypothetical protein